MTEPANSLHWRRSRGCANSTCIEVAKDADRYLIRDSKNADAAPLSFTAAEWHAFVTGIKQDEFSFDD